MAGGPFICAPGSWFTITITLASIVGIDGGGKVCVCDTTYPKKK